MSREFKFGDWFEGQKMSKTVKSSLAVQKSNIIFLIFFVLQFDMFLIYVFWVKMFGGQRKAQLILEHSIILYG